MTVDASGTAYTAIIRTHCSFPQVESVVHALRNQSCPPREIIVVDNGSPVAEKAALRLLCDALVDYPPEPFNFAKAINLGVDAVKTPCCLIISSHFIIDDPTLIEACTEQMRARRLCVFYVSNVRRRDAVRHDVITAASFNGSNGFSSACGFVPVAIVRERRFREEVFACEDQEWAAWYLRERGAAILKVGSPGIRYVNPRVNEAKKFNEELAIAAFVDRRRLSPCRIAWRFVRAGWHLLGGDRRRAAFERRVAVELWLARRRTPRRESRYF